MADEILIHTEHRADGWAVIVDDKYGRHERAGIATEAEANRLVMDLTILVHNTFDMPAH